MQVTPKIKGIIREEEKMDQNLFFWILRNIGHENIDAILRIKDRQGGKGQPL